MPVGSLAAGDSPRLAGEDSEHIRLLAESETRLPPLLVHRRSMRVVDGIHRLRAARLRGDESIEVEFFDGDEAEAFIAAVMANVTHGLPLTLADREAAARRIILSHPHYADRTIGAATGLAAKTVATIRGRVDQDGDHVAARLGRDGRLRPLSSERARLVASDLIAQHPEASLREVARAAGLSPATVRDVRERLRRGDHPVPPRQRSRRPDDLPDRPTAGRTATVAPADVRKPATVLQSLSSDPSLRYTESGRALLRGLLVRATGPEKCQSLIDAAPPHCKYLLVEVARGLAHEWSTLADRLERQLSEDAPGAEAPVTPPGSGRCR